MTETLACFLHGRAKDLSAWASHKVSGIYFLKLYSINTTIYRNIILLVALYGCETWSLTLCEESKLRVFENMVLRRIFGHRRDEVTGGMEETA